ncbi:MAG: baseplate J/gp47 family protein [Saprospiraceae bacterium]
MKNCLALPAHPFKNAPGTSQRHRALSALSPDSAPVDGATLAERLLFIADFARQVNFYQPDPERPVLAIDNWQRFFSDSPPFVLARLIKTNTDDLTNTLATLATSVDNQPAPETLRLLRDFVVNDLYYTLNDSFYILQGQPNALITLWDNAIRTELSASLTNLILQSRRFYKKSGLSMPDFQRFIETDSWGIDLPDLYVQTDGSDDALAADALYRQIALEFYHEGTAALGVLQRVVAEAPAFLPETLYPATEAYQQNHPPHLGLVFAFLQLFELFGKDLNGLSKLHLEYFFETVLHLSPRKPRPDAAHLVFEVQQNLDRYLLKKGTAVKDGKDSLGKEIDFTLDEEIVVDKAKVEQLLTLFRQTVATAVCDEEDGLQVSSATEGLYIATKADSADGKGEAFGEQQSKTWPTLGSKLSKLVPKGKTAPQSHPSARMGFVLASPVLFLQEGTRKITFTLTCRYNGEEKIFDKLNHDGQQQIGRVFHVITDEALKQAQQEGLSPAGQQLIRSWLEHRNPYSTWSESEPCFLPVSQCPQPAGSDTNIGECENVCATDPNDTDRQLWKSAETLLDCLKPEDKSGGNETSDYTILEKITRRTTLKLSLSGEKEWIPVDLGSVVESAGDVAYNSISISDKSSEGVFTLTIRALLSPKQPGVTFFSKENLKEDLGTDLPVAKFEVDPDIKIWCPNATGDPACCFEKGVSGSGVYVSLWDFFGNTQITKAAIKVEVCGVRNIVVQNDENVQDVNSPIFPFGTRPEVPGFSVVEVLTPDPNQTGPNFYIGSREVFLKKWETVSVNLEWKDLPTNFGEHYYAYRNNPLIHKEDFKIKASILEDGVWIKETISPPRELFEDKASVSFSCAPQGETIQTIQFTSSNFNVPAFIQKFDSEIRTPLSSLKTDTRNGFLSLQLYEQDFLHRDYPFVLARQMLAFGKYPDGVKDVPGAVRKYDDVNNPPSNLEDLLQEMVDDLLKQLAGTPKGVNDLVSPIYSSITSSTLHHDPPNNTDVERFDDGLDDVINVIISKLITIKGNASTLLSTQIDTVVQGLFAQKQKIESYLVWAASPFPDPIPISVPIAITEAFDQLKTALSLLLEEMEGHLLTLPIPPDPPFDLVQNDQEMVARYSDGVNDRLSDIIDRVQAVLNSNITIPDALSLRYRIQGIITYLFSKRSEAIIAQNGGIPIPFEPYTPTLKYISLDYIANAETQDINFIHLHAYPDTFKQEAFSNEPLLVAAPPAAAFALGTDLKGPAEGTLYIGLKNLTPGSNLNLLFQLAEASADSEVEKARIAWQYLSNNEWRDLREGFEILDDGTKGLTASGIVKIAVPPDITNGPENTLLPRGLHWIKVAAPANTRAVCETIGVHTQAVRATFALTPQHDPARSATPLPAGSLAKLRVADANVKKVGQPYESFGGREAEDTGASKAAFYQRAAERLRHKGRAINAFDYERIVLDAFPEVYKVKCIPHDMALGAARHHQDLEWAPGFVTLVVIPDLTRLKAGENITPRVPISLLESIEEEVCRRSSPFARIRVFNPRYEGIHVNIEVVLLKNLDQKYYEAQLQKDIAHFLAPWYLGDNEKLRFGQAVYYSDLLKFVESLPYVDFVTSLLMSHESKGTPKDAEFQAIIEPLSARSILTAGIITVCPGPKPACPPDMQPNPCNNNNPNTQTNDGQQEPILV